MAGDIRGLCKVRNIVKYTSSAGENGEIYKINIIEKSYENPRDNLSNYFLLIENNGGKVESYKNTFFPVANALWPNSIRGIWNNNVIEVITFNFFNILKRRFISIEGKNPKKLESMIFGSDLETEKKE